MPQWLRPLFLPTHSHWLNVTLYIIALFAFTWAVTYVIVLTTAIRHRVGMRLTLLFCHAWSALATSAVLIACLLYALFFAPPPSYRFLIDPLPHYLALLLLLGPILILLGRRIGNIVSDVEGRMT